MPTSLCQIAVHIIFGTKRHRPFLTDEIHPYIHGIITNVKGVPIRINGTENHIHILTMLPKDMSVADFVRTIKANSSKWFKATNPHMEWQTGYAAFGVSKPNIPIIDTYIQNQKEHHHKMSFAEEMQKYLVEMGAGEVYNEWFEGLDEE